MRESVRMYDVSMAQFVLKIGKLSHIGARGSQDLRSPFPIMAPGDRHNVRFKPVKSDVLNTDMSIVKLAVCVNKFGRSSNPKCDGKTLGYDVLLR